LTSSDLISIMQDPRNTLVRLADQWSEDTVLFLRHDAPKIVGILIVTFVLMWLLKALSKRLVAFSKRQALPTGIRAQQIRTLADVFYSVGLFVLLFMALMQVLQVVGIDIKPLLASAGIAGLAIGFGAQTLVKDVINGFFLLVENQFDVGDVVRVSGVQGTVESLTMRRTVLRDADGTVHTIPNSAITIVSNQTRDWTQLAMHISVAYREDSEMVVRLLKEVGQQMRNDPKFAEAIVADPEVPGIEKISGEEVDYLMLVKTLPGSRYPVSRELRRRIKECFQKNKIEPGNPSKVYVVDPGVRK
jgi:moderate conductance mechanosensitive channel